MSREVDANMDRFDCMGDSDNYSGEVRGVGSEFLDEGGDVIFPDDGSAVVTSVSGVILVRGADEAVVAGEGG